MGNDHENDRSAPKRPEDVLRDGNIKASIWRNESERGDFFATTFARTHKDDEGNVRDSHNFVGADLLKLSELARKTYDRTNEIRREEFKSRRKEESRDHSRSRSKREK